MDEIFVQFSDATQKTIISAFSASQNPVTWPNQGTVTASDARWATYYAMIPADAQAAWPAPTS